MPSIGDVTGARRRRQRRRLVAGTVLLLAGGVLVAIGAAGIAGVSSVGTGLFVGGLAVMIGLTVLVLRAPLDHRERTTAAIGLVIGLSGAALFGVVEPVRSVWWGLVAGMGLLVGSVVVVAAVIAAVVMRSTERPSATDPATGWARVGSGDDASRAAADGGREADDLRFPLEEE